MKLEDFRERPLEEGTDGQKIDYLIQEVTIRKAIRDARAAAWRIALAVIPVLVSVVGGVIALATFWRKP